MSHFIVTTKGETDDGRELVCTYGVRTRPATYWEPEDYDQGEASYTLDGDETEYDEMPPEVQALADKLYEAGEGEYSYKQSDPRYYDEPDYS